MLLKAIIYGLYQYVCMQYVAGILKTCLLIHIPYMSKHSRGKTLAVFVDFSKTQMFYQNANVLPLNFS